MYHYLEMAIKCQGVVSMSWADDHACASLRWMGWDG
jgi:hypothetical protein